MRLSEDKLYGKPGTSFSGSTQHKNYKEVWAARVQREETLDALEKKFHEIDRQIDELDEKDPLYNKLLNIRAYLAQTLRTAKRGR